MYIIRKKRKELGKEFSMWDTNEPVTLLMKVTFVDTIIVFEL